MVPSLVKEVQGLSRNAPAYAADLRHNATFRHYDNRYHITPKLVHDARRLPQLLGHLVGPLKDVTVQAFSFIADLVTVLALTFLLILHGRQYVNMGLSLTGAREPRYRQMIIDIKDAVANYMLGNIVISVLATIATWIVLSILGVPYALSLGFVVGFFDLIPLVGATLGAIVVGFATLTVSFPVATIVWVVVHHRLAAVRGLRRPAVRLREGAPGQSDRHDRLGAGRRVSSRHPRCAAGDSDRGGDPDRAARLVGQPGEEGAGEERDTGRHNGGCR